MFKWSKFIKNADSHTKYFLFNWALYGLMIIASTIYVYVRIGYLRNTPAPPAQQKMIDANSQK